jgi:hypothetical protein
LAPFAFSIPMNGIVSQWGGDIWTRAQFKKKEPIKDVGQVDLMADRKR